MSEKFKSSYDKQKNCKENRVKKKNKKDTEKNEINNKIRDTLYTVKEEEA